jgi:hypothetical protein
MTITPQWSQKCWDFLEYWKSLRGGALMPTSETILDTLPGKFVSAAYIVELTESESIVRFQGADLLTQWGVDRTGQDIGSHRSSKLQATILAINRTIVEHTCGYISQSSNTTSRGRDVDICIIRLPVAVKAGRRPRVVACVDESQMPGEREEAWNKYRVVGHAWCDIGAGVPDFPPSPIMQ